MSSQPLRRSRRLASIIPASYWISIGYAENDAQFIEKLQNDMKYYADDGDNDDTKIDLGFGTDITDFLSVMIPNRYILPHWQRFAKGLNGRTSFEEIAISGITLPVSVLDTIFPTFQMMNLNTLSLFNVRLGNDGFLRLSSFLEEDTSINTLILGGDTIDDMSVTTTLSVALSAHPTLDTLALGSCGLSNSTILEAILQGCTGLRCLGISFETLGLDIAVIADFIRSNHSTLGITLSNDNFSDDDVVILASALKINKTSSS